MTSVVTLDDVDFMWQSVIMPRIGDVYVFGGSLNPNVINQGTDCTGAGSEVNEAVLYGPQMDWQRQFWTGTFAGAMPGDVGPFGGVDSTTDWVCIESPDKAPPGCAVIFAVLQLSNPEDAHMVCAALDPNNVTGFGGPGKYVGVESGGSYTDADGNSTLHIGPEATNIRDPMFNQYFALNVKIGQAPLTKQQSNALAVINAGEALGVSPLGCQMGLACAFAESSMLMYANSGVPESLNYPHDAVGNNYDSCGPFQQRPSAGWGSVACEMDWKCSATLFFNALLKVRINGNDYNSGVGSPGSWVQAVQISAFPDAYDAQWNNAVALYNSVISPYGDEGFLMALTDSQQAEIYARLCTPTTSTSPFRTLGEGAIWPPAQLLVNDDGFSHPQYVEWCAAHGDSNALAALQALATASPSKYPDRAGDIALAQMVLTRIGQAPAPNPVGPSPVPFVINPPPAPVPVPSPTPAPAPAPSNTVPKSTVIHSVITLMGGGLAIGTWMLHTFGGVMSPGVTTAVSAVVAAGTAALDFLVKAEDTPPTEAKP